MSINSFGFLGGNKKNDRKPSLRWASSFVVQPRGLEVVASTVSRQPGEMKQCARLECSSIAALFTPVRAFRPGVR